MVALHFVMVGTPRCGVTGRVQRTESRYPLLCLHSVAPLNAARSSQRDDPTLKLQTVPPPHFGIDCPKALARVFPQFPEKIWLAKASVRELAAGKTFNRKEHSMSNHSNNNYPRLHNAMWPGLVGKGSPGAEPFIDLDTMLD